jgi:ABC-type uncharacterized transport system permease subunit
VSAVDLSLGCAIALFLTTAFVDGFAKYRQLTPLSHATRWGIRAGWVVLTAGLAAQGWDGLGSPAGILGWIAWGTAGLTLFLDLTFGHRLPSWIIGLVAGVCLVTASQLSWTPGDRQPWVTLHVAAAILAYCILSAQALNSLVYLLQDRALSRRSFGGVYALLPPLVPLDRIGHQMLGAAVWMLGLALVVGAVGKLQGLEVPPAKLAASALTWTVAALILLARRRGRLTGAAFARGSLAVLVPAALALWLSLPR